MSASANPLEVVHNLVGITLPEGWVVKEKIKRETSDTGGYFSVSYLVEKTSGEAAFMKVLNLAKALTMPGDQLRNIQNLITTFNFERDTLDVCRSNNFKRVATALSHGKLEIPGNIFGVYYIIFELAQGCIRKHMAKIGSLDRMWILRSLHHTANGIRQLHSKKISHQDIKPSNVLIFSGVESKVADLGCADIKYGASPRGGLMVAGDQSYAPIELLYGEVSPLWERRRMGTDMYLFGSLVTFLFSQVTVTSQLLANMHHSHRPGFWTGDYRSVLPYVRNAFGAAVDQIKQHFPADIRDDLVLIIKFLCEPDPVLRGANDYRGSEQYSFERVVSILNRLAHKAEIALKFS